MTIQAARTLTLPENADGSTPLPTPVRGYFHSWEDYALFFLFGLFTYALVTSFRYYTTNEIFRRLEAAARIITTGFIFDPEVPASMLFRSPFSSDPRSPGIARESQSLHHSNSTSSGLNRNLSQRHNHTVTKLSTWLSNFSSNIFRPFALAHHKPSVRSSSSLSVPVSSAAASAMNLHDEKLNQALPHLRDPSKPTFFARALHSDGGLSTTSSVDTKDPREYLGLPFRISVRTARGQLTRNVPYLRHSWNRIDFIAILAFWITFALASAGVERSSSHHIAVFRALSVLRTSRLLAVTSGTTVCAQCLLT